MIERIRLFLVLEIAVFVAAALVHFEVLADGYDDAGAGIAESVIAIVLLGGLLLSLVRPETTREACLVAQAFGLLGTLVGTTLLITVGPRTTLDIVFHVTMLVLLVIGLAVTVRSPADNVTRTA
jgi:peptidoglycan/LPS O-acetylase OafA/YrhL